MTVPSSFAVTIVHNGVDITSHCPRESYDLDDLVLDVSSFRFRIENPATVPVKDDLIQVIAIALSPAHTIFLGYMVEVREQKRANGIISEYEIDCAD